MSFQLTISGHKDTASEQESRDFEESVKDLAAEFVSTLEGVTVATGSFGTLGEVNLLDETAQ